MWHDLYKGEFPEVQEKNAVIVQFERLESAIAEPTVSFQALEAPLWRSWFLSRDEGTQLMQFQTDWLARNWRRMPGHEDEKYPRYPTLKERFERDTGRFVDYAAGQGWGEVAFTQCELTYINHIDLKGLGLGPGDLDRVIGLAGVPTNDPFLPAPESLQFNARYLIREDEPVARLYVAASPAFRREGGDPILVLTLTAKGPPGAKGLDDVLRFFDTVRTWIVKGFTNLTTPQMHQAWGRRADG